MTSDHIQTNLSKVGLVTDGVRHREYVIASMRSSQGAASDITTVPGTRLNLHILLTAPPICAQSLCRWRVSAQFDQLLCRLSLACRIHMLFYGRLFVLKILTIWQKIRGVTQIILPAQHDWRPTATYFIVDKVCLLQML